MTEFPSKEAINRREFIRGSIRNVLLAGISALTARAFMKSGGRLTGQSCINEGICRPCPSFSDCGLPQALSLKNAIKRKPETGGRA